MQLAINGGRLECIDIADVVISSIIGGLVPGSLSSFKTISKALQKNKQLNGYLRKVKNEKNRKKFLRRKKKANINIRNELAIRVGAIGAISSLHKLFNFRPIGKCGC